MPRSVVSIAATIAFAWLLAAPALVPAQPATVPTPPDRIDQLIALLGHPQYRLRENAARELETLGMEAKPAILLASLENLDHEVQVRCRRLLPVIDFNFCWERAQATCWPNPSDRGEFEALYCVEPDLWFAFASQSDEFVKQYTARVQELGKGPSFANRQGVVVMMGNRSSPWSTDQSLSTLLQLGVACRERIAPETLREATVLYTRQWGGRYAAEKDTPSWLRKSYVAWAQNIAPLPIEYEGTQKLQLAREALRSKTAPTRDKQYALLTVARAKDQKDDELIRSFLNDDAVCDTLFRKGVKVQVQLRDVALACTIYRAGKDPIRFGFPKAVSDPDLVYRPSTLGFAGDDERAEAFQMWKNAVGPTP